MNTVVIAVAAFAALAAAQEEDELYREVLKFPPWEVVKANLEFSKELQANMEAQRDWYFGSSRYDRYYFYADYVSDLIARRGPWEELRNIHMYGKSNGPDYIRCCLKDIRGYIGDSNYALGQMPQVAPWYRFQIR